MFGPSPDWVVGLSGVNLCEEDCSWKDSLDFDLYPWDAGTDSGITYMSANQENQPRERMRRITPMYPEDPRAPFYNPSIQEVPPMARVYLRKERNIPKGCDEEVLQAQLETQLEEAEDDSRGGLKLWEVLCHGLTIPYPFQLSARLRITRIGHRAQSPAERDYECAPGSL